MVGSRLCIRDHPTRSGSILLAMIAFLGVSAGRCEAQFGYGFGYGIGFQNNAYQDTQFLNSWSLQNAASAAANRPQPLTAPRFQTRDEGFNDRYDLATREAMMNRIARHPNQEMDTVNPAGIRASTPPPRAPSTPAPQPMVLLANFFDRSRRLIWPDSAPVTDGMGKKRDISDVAVLDVLNEYETIGLARVSVVTEARQKLLDYGRPALDFVRKNSTPAISDSFHTFLLSLYSNVGLAATVRKNP